MKVSVMMDSNGCNTTAAAAIASARKHMNLAGCKAIVLGATGAGGTSSCGTAGVGEGQSDAGLPTLDRGSGRGIDSGQEAEARVTAASATQPADFMNLCQNSAIIVAAGAAGVFVSLKPDRWENHRTQTGH